MTQQSDRAIMVRERVKLSLIGLHCVKKPGVLAAGVLFLPNPRSDVVGSIFCGQDRDETLVFHVVVVVVVVVVLVNADNSDFEQLQRIV